MSVTGFPETLMHKIHKKLGKEHSIVPLFACWQQVILVLVCEF